MINKATISNVLKKKTPKTNFLKKQALLKALEKQLGIVTPACKEIGINRSTYYEWINNDEKFKKAVDELKGVALDFVESHLFQQIKSDVPSSTIYFLKTQGKERGYVEKIYNDNIHRFDDSVDERVKQILNEIK